MKTNYLTKLKNTAYSTCFGITRVIVCVLATISVVGLSSCTTSISQGSDGSWSYSGELVPPPTPDDGVIIRTLDGEEK